MDGNHVNYLELKKPYWAPAGWVFRPVWTVLYVLMAISFGAVFYKTFSGEIEWVVALPFALNLVFNLAFTPIQFGLKNNLLASVDILLVLITLIWAIAAISLASLKLSIIGQPGILWITYIQIPYLLWVGFATVLQLTITFLNR